MNKINAASLVELRLREGDIQVSRGRTALVTGPAGTVLRKKPNHGLFIYQTRVLGKYVWRMNGKEPEFSCGSNIEQHNWMGYYIQAPHNWRETPAHESNPLQQTVELRLRRSVGEGMHEDVQLTNHTQVSTSVQLKLEFEPQFVSREEARGKRKQHGTLTKDWKQHSSGVWELEFKYAANHHYEHQGNYGEARFHRGVTLRIENTDSPPTHFKNSIKFEVTLKPQGTWHACLSWLGYVSGKQLPLAADCSACKSSNWEEKRIQFLHDTSSFTFGNDTGLQGIVRSVLQRSKMDIAALRILDLEKDRQAVLEAGVPTYMGVFGRDMLTSAWQASLLGPELALGSLDIVGREQASETNAWRDAEPGRILHEMHTDPLSVLNFRPKTLYYGSVSSSFLYPIMVSELWHWTGDLELMRRFVGFASRALQWADKYSLDETGFYRYQTHSKQGMKNQGWKDSEDAIVYPDGSQVPVPIGTCEMQAFVYAAKIQLSEVLWWLGDVADAKRLFIQAKNLKGRFNDKFWMEDEGYLAMGIDNDGELIRSVASDPGHCLATGIVEESRVPQVAQRMLRKDLFSGWGIRTLSAEHPAYNPFSYHRGTVWPVENGSFILGFARYGFHEEVQTLARALFEAATLFPHYRLPETFAGHQRNDETPFPGLYTRADWPQAWSASAVFAALQGILSLYPYAPANVLFVDPHLPEWLPEITVENLRVGKAVVTLKFDRKLDGTCDYAIVELKGELHVLRQPSPWSLTAGWAERAKDAILSLLPPRSESA